MSKSLAVDEAKPQLNFNKRSESLAVFKKEQWWRKKPTLQSDLNVNKKVELEECNIISPDISSSTKDFLNEEEFCEVHIITTDLMRSIKKTFS